MRLHRFYINEIVGNKKEITLDSADVIAQIRRVFRLKGRDEVVVFDGSGFDYQCRINEKSDRSFISLDVISVSKSRYIGEINIHLYASVIKKDKFEWVVEKATELGVKEITPILAERSEKKSLNLSRLQKIAKESSEQCGRGDVPKINEIMTLEESLKTDRLPKIALHLEGKMLHEAKEYKEAGIWIGGEGGWSDKELELFHQNNVTVMNMGRQILRAETASVAALSILLLG